MQSERRMHQSDGVTGKKAAEEGAGGRGCVVLPLRWEGGEERVEIIGRVVVEEYMEFYIVFGDQTLLVFHCFYQAFNCGECVGTH